MKTCINIISSRTKCIKHCLDSLWENYNKEHNYTVFVYYFDDIYDSSILQSSIIGDSKQDTRFVNIEYKTPEFIAEDELYYNRDLWYVKNRFSKNRKGYLHMCHFTSNMYGYPNTELEEYDYIITHDDEAGYSRPMTQNPVEILSKTEYKIGAYFVGQRLKDGHPHQGHRDTRVGLWDFTKSFIMDNSVTPKSELLKSLLDNGKAEDFYHYLKWCDTYVIKTGVFRSDLWKKWIAAVNDSGGIYKYRWGDNEIITLFAYMIQDKVFNFNLVSDGTHVQNKFRHIQDYAPGVKDLNK